MQEGLKKPSDFGNIWGELKSDLSKLSSGKCWYCESRQTRSDNAVDHFRPKSVYPWYAFNYENYRFACSFCNSPHKNPLTGITQGKSNYFPLLGNSTFARNEAEIDLEQPILLDPCNPADPRLLDFLVDGTPCSRYADNETFTRRVTESIRIYHLDQPDLVEQRRRLALRIDGLIKAADRQYARVLQGDQDAELAFVEFVRDIVQLLDDSAELSVFARRVVLNHRTKDWVQGILDTV